MENFLSGRARGDTEQALRRRGANISRKERQGSFPDFLISPQKGPVLGKRTGPQLVKKAKNKKAVKEIGGRQGKGRNGFLLFPAPRSPPPAAVFVVPSL